MFGGTLLIPMIVHLSIACFIQGKKNVSSILGIPEKIKSNLEIVKNVIQTN